MRESLGLIEVVGLSSAIEVSDTMVKAANVELVELEVTKGGGYVVVKVVGDVGAVKAAVDAGTACAMKYACLVSRHVIARPLEETHKAFTEPAPNKKRPMFYGTTPVEPKKKTDVVAAAEEKPEEPAAQAVAEPVAEPAKDAEQPPVAEALEVKAEPAPVEAANEAAEPAVQEGAAEEAKPKKKTAKKRVNK